MPPCFPQQTDDWPGRWFTSLASYIPEISNGFSLRHFHQMVVSCFFNPRVSLSALSRIIRDDQGRKGVAASSVWDEARQVSFSASSSLMCLARCSTRKEPSGFLAFPWGMAQQSTWYGHIPIPVYPLPLHVPRALIALYLLLFSLCLWHMLYLSTNRMLQLCLRITREMQ